MKTRGFLAIVLIVFPYVARGATELYIGMGEVIVPIDWASTTSSGEMNQFFESFSGTRFYFRVREGYESELISMGTPTPTGDGGMAAVSESVDAWPSAGQALIFILMGVTLWIVQPQSR